MRSSHLVTMLAGVLSLCAAACTIQMGPTDEGDTTGEDDTTDEGDTTGGNTGENGGGETFTPPANVEVLVRGAYIAPGKADGSCWDGVACAVDQETRNQIAEALAETGDPYAAAAGVAIALSGLAQDAYGPPDALGVASLWNGGTWDQPINLATYDNNYEDTFTPSWPGDPSQGYAIGWRAPFNEDFRIHVGLVDEDLTNDDPIGDVDINYEHVVAALQAQETYPVRVAEQGSGLILFVQISAYGVE